MKYNPGQWYTEQVLGVNSIRKVVKNLLSSGDIDGYFTNHSLRWSGCTRLFQAGIERKIVKEISGHRSDVIDRYQLTSDDQWKKVNEILACNNVEVDMDSGEKKEVVEGEPVIEKKLRSPSNVQLLSSVSIDSQGGCSCKKTYISNGNLSEMIDAILKFKGENAKATIKLEIEIQSK